VKGLPMFVALALAAGLLAGCGTGGHTSHGGAADSAYVAAIAGWQAERVASLREPDGWLSLAGLYWLRPGENTFGADPANRLVFPAGKAPGRAGVLVLDSAAVTLRARPGAAITCDGRPATVLALRADADSGGPDVLALGSLRFHVIRRGDRVGVRLKDLESPALAGFRGLEYYPVDPGWRVAARWEAHDPPRRIPIANVLGDVNEAESPGVAVFERGGRTYRLEPIREEGSDELFFIFGDATNGRGTYGAGRFLYAQPPGPDGRIELDFNRAYNPPCTFTSFATCPLPPAQNRLAVAVTAGEKAYAGGRHP
jgi:uncharacterized protein (DUF1684 family)